MIQSTRIRGLWLCLTSSLALTQHTASAQGLIETNQNDPNNVPPQQSDQDVIVVDGFVDTTTCYAHLEQADANGNNDGKLQADEFVESATTNPAFEESAMFENMIDLMFDDEYEAYVFDTAPTANTRRLQIQHVGVKARRPNNDRQGVRYCASVRQ